MVAKGTPDLAAMMLSPYEYFPDPMAVARDDRLGKEEKLSILKSMEADARELEIADEENMGGGEQHSLASVRRAVRAVDPEAAARSEAAQTSKAL
ncbi:hypothetical protein [Thalassobaculum sp.]|uniref:hypothetical protein n=1 Tax=Thalassobaculum sp. TaxID=2022740 RepID=UPI003B5B876A